MLPPRGPQYGNCKPTRWTWHELPDVTCLDGSPAGFYHTRAIGPVFAHSWVIYFEGGGWCVSPEDCALRGTTTRGSSRHWPGNGTRFGQLLHMCCFATPFCRFHRVMLKSCDGHSFAGEAEIASPQVRAAQMPAVLHSTGRAIVRATMSILLDRLDLHRADDVLVAGCSAGGLAALLHAEAIRDALRARGALPRRFKVASLAGLFFPAGGGTAAAADTAMPFVQQVVQAVALGRMRFSPKCLTRWPASEPWRCFFGAEPLEALPADIPAFVVQSRLDLWQTSCVVAAAPSRFSELHCAHGNSWSRCLNGFKPIFYSRKTGQLSACSGAQWQQLHQFEQRNGEALAQSRALLRRGSGSWVHSCHDHCPGFDMLLYAGARRAESNESFNMRQAIFEWFWDCDTARETTALWICKPRDGGAPSSRHSYVGCPNAVVQRGRKMSTEDDAVRGPAGSLCHQECGVPDKLAHDLGKRVAASIRKLGWNTNT